VLLCKRKWENDYDGIYSFIGGKMEITDESLMKGLEREKNEEVWEVCKIKVYPTFSTNLLFRKKSGDCMVLPHYYARHIEGDININEEYSDFQWVKITDLDQFEPKIPNIPDTIRKLMALQKIIIDTDFIII
jgi:ADP-ribose pyrophosphatase YjhB (NUDIX family)